MKKLFIILFALLILIPGGSYAINTILGGAVVAPSGQRAPTVVTLLTTTGSIQVMEFLSSFSAISTSPFALVKTSPTGVTWTNTPSQPPNSGFNLANSLGKILASNSTGVVTSCNVSWSADNGSTWTTVDISAISVNGCAGAGPGDGSRIKCEGATCFMTGVDRTTVAPQNCTGATACIKIFKSTNSGSSWGLAFSGGAGSSSTSKDSTLIISGNNVVAAAGSTASSCGAITGKIYSSTDGGSGWNTTDTGLCILFPPYGTKLSNTYYVEASFVGGGTPQIFFTSTDLINWTNAGSPTLIPARTLTAANANVAAAFNNYVNPTMYYIVHDNIAGGHLFIYTSEDGSSFTQLSDLGVAASIGSTVLRITQDPNTKELYFVTSLSNVFKIGY